MILGGSLDPKEISKQLALRPSQQWRRGDLKSFKKKDGSTRLLDSVHEWGGWKKWMPDKKKGEDVSKLVKYWCGMLSRKQRALSRIRATQCQIYLDCCIVDDASQFILEPGLLAKLASLGISLRVNFYSVEKD